MTPAVSFGFNVLLSLVMFFGGMVINYHRRELQHLRRMQETHAKENAEKFARMPIDYVLRDDYKDFQKAIIAKLDRIEQKLDGKVDKSEA